MTGFSVSVALVCWSFVFSLTTTCGFAPSSITSRRSSQLRASGGPPPYDKELGTLIKNEEIGAGTQLLRIEAKNTYEPGHVLALEIQEAEDTWAKGPYTITRATLDNFDVVLKVVGDRSKLFAKADLGTPLRFGGKFHVPIAEGVEEGATRVVCLATGSGVGPVVGFAERADYGRYAVHAFVSYRSSDDVCNLLPLLPKNAEFHLTNFISGGENRLSDDETLASIAELHSETTHYHLIGNGGMVAEFKLGLEKAGVSRVTVETYFNHKAEPDQAVVDRIAATISESAKKNALANV